MRFANRNRQLATYTVQNNSLFKEFLGCMARAEEICNDQPVYFYELNVQTKMFHEEPYKNGATEIRKDFSRADHGDDMIYMFGIPFIASTIPDGRYFSNDEKELSKRMMTSWSNFAKFGKPGWERFESTSKVIKEFNTPVDSIKSGNDLFYQNRLKFWRQEYKEE